MLAPLIALGAAATLFFVVLIATGGRNDVSRRIAELESLPASGAPKVLAQSPVFQRILASVDKSAVAAKLAEAGWYGVSVPTFVAARVGAAAAVAAAAFAAAFVLGQTSMILIAALAVGAMFGMTVPSFVIDGAIKKRKLAIGNRLPDMLDLVATTVEAGTALNGALATATASLTGPLAEELQIVLSDIRVGRTRADAFIAMSARVKQQDLSGLVTAIVQTEKLGGNIGNVLDELSQEARSRRLMRAEEIAASLPVKMVVPMALFMLPALFVMIFTPVIANMMSGK